ncbi:hypothetical protein [Pseudomonas phage Itty13]|uniref:Uncharacterized protein n=1 Tax=Pseudomonas phage Itty13 TaxID=2805750 RepID=A0A889ISB7_9CAUD|nr:hypothetical protein PQC19_gp72 [Pseudomonas phage Itty13]QRE00648.1 hypothetical protein [Pseudomonas phage Itty13]
MNLSLIDQRINEAKTETECAQWIELRNALVSAEEVKISSDIHQQNRLELLREARLMRFSADINTDISMQDKIDPHMAWANDLDPKNRDEWIHVVEKMMHIALKHGLWVDPFADIGFPAGRWCETMDRPAARCGCPDCGSSLVQQVEGMPE